MIEYISGVLAAKSPMTAVIEVGGIGYEVFISLQTFENLPQSGAEVRLLAHLHVREDSMQLFGFLNEDERIMFRSLQSISGIGVRTALSILSGCGAARLRNYVAAGDVHALTGVPGVGKKTAERIVVELRDRIAKVSVEFASQVRTEAGDPRSEAVMGLTALGYARPVAEKALNRAFQELPEAERTAANLIKAALQAILG